MLDPKTHQPFVDKKTGLPFVDCPVERKNFPPVSMACPLLPPKPAGTNVKKQDDDDFGYLPTVINTDPHTNDPYEFDMTTGEVVITLQDSDDPCAITFSWVQYSNCWSDVPKCCRTKYGYHCGTYVWVDPCHTREFAKLVYAITDYASQPGRRTVANRLENERSQILFQCRRHIR